MPGRVGATPLWAWLREYDGALRLTWKIRQRGGDGVRKERLLRDGVGRSEV